MLLTTVFDAVAFKLSDGHRIPWSATHDVLHGGDLSCQISAASDCRPHAILDDSSRFIVALRVYPHEREIAMLELVLEAVHNYGAPKVLYLDSGATYRGTAFSTVCGRLGTTLLHPNPYAP